MSSEVIVIGAGAAGLSAVLELARNQIPSILISQMPSERAQSVMAEGGINSALDTLGEGDSAEMHAEDTLKAGAYLADPAAVRAMTKAAPAMVEELFEQGLSLNVTSDGKIDLRSFGGQSAKRTAYADAGIGKQLMHTLTAQVRRFEKEGMVTRMTGWYFLDLLLKEGTVQGCRLFNRENREIRDVFSPAVIVAAGGMNGLFGNATGSMLNTGAVTAMLFAAGVPLANGEMIQYHPTTVRRPGKNMLITEAVRAEGGRLYILKDEKPYYFMEERFPEKGNLMPRDVISLEEWKLMREGHSVYLDMRGLGRSAYEDKLRGVVRDCRQFLNLDVRREPIPVEPGIHYFMGGIDVDAAHRTGLRGIYAAGECACMYHGANRLGGNSLLGSLFGGKTAAESAMRDLRKNPPESTDQSVKKSPEELLEERQPVLHLPSEQKKLQAAMRNALGIMRDEDSLRDGIRLVEAIRKRAEAGYDPEAFLDENYVWMHQCDLALGILYSALERKESRGAHRRAEYPYEDPEFKKTTLAVREKDKISVYFRETGGISYADRN